MARVPTGRRTERGVQQQGLGRPGSRQEAPGDIQIPGAARDPGLSVNPDQFGAQVGEALAGVGSAVGSLAEVQRQVAERRQQSEDSIFLARARTTLNQRLYETTLSTQTEVENAGNYFETVTPKYEETRSSVLTDLQQEYSPSQEALDRYEAMAEGLVGDYGIKAITFENNQKVAKYRSDLNLEVNALAESVLANGNIETGLASLNETLSGFRNVLRPDEFREVKQAAEATLASAYLEGVIRDDPAGAGVVRDYGLGGGDGTIIGAIIDQESNGNPNAVSSKGATGLMQVMPATAREIARELGDDGFPEGGSEREIREYLKNEDVNLRYGKHYFRKMLRRYGGDVEAALVAYNGGPGRADAWLKAGRDDSVLPNETADYYKAVLGRVDQGGGNALAVAFKHLPIDQQLRFVDRAERASAVGKRRFEDRFSAHLANIENFGTGLSGFSLARDGRVLDGDELAEARAAEEQAFIDHESIRTIRYGSPEEAVAAVDDAEPVPGSPDIEDQLTRRQRYLKALQERRDGVAEDPAGYVRQGFEDVEAAWETALESREPAEVRQAADLTLEAQESLGVSQAERRILPKSVAASVVSGIQQTPSGERAQRLEAELDLWGGHRNRVLRDLRSAGLSDMAYIAALHSDNPAVAQRLSAAMETGVDALREGLEETTVSDMRAQLNEEFREYREVFEAGDLTGSATGEMNALLSAAEVLAMQDIRRGANPATAARSARELLVDTQVAIVDGGRVTSLVPNQFRSGAVERGAETMLDRERVEAMDVEPFGSVTGFGSFDEERTLRKIVADGQWFYTGDGETMTLMVPFASLSPSRSIKDFIAVKKRGGERVTLSFEEAEAMGVSAGAFGPVIRGGPGAVAGQVSQ